MLSNVGFIYADINCQLKIHFSNSNGSFFDSMDDLISKTEGFPNDSYFLLPDSTEIFSSFCFQMISLSEASTKEVL